MVRYAFAALILCLLPWQTGTTIISISQGSCPLGWVTFNNRCFQHINVMKTWADAEKYCLSQGGHLVSVNSAAENSFLKDYISSVDRFDSSVWIGLINCQKGGTCKWSDGNLVVFASWSPRKPKTGKGNCAKFTTKGWRNVSCSNIFPFICAR